ncbi:MAG: trypsin-like serine peptidase [Streptosporangiales bacterium]
MTLAAAVAIAVVGSPQATGAERLAARLAAAVKALPRRARTVPPALLHGQFYNGTPAVGALFTTAGSGLGQHFCTASVVASPVKDLVITAAHCLAGYQPGQVEFVPGYHRGQQPFGAWQVTQIFVDEAWASSGNPDDDVAFLAVHQPGDAEQVQDLAGGETLATGWKAVQLAQVIGYPDGRQRPISCTSRTRAFGSYQMEFDCGGYTNGTSGGPFLVKVHAATGLGTVLGVIGGYQEGGDTPSVSYSARFGQQVRSLYNEAVARS